MEYVSTLARSVLVVGTNNFYNNNLQKPKLNLKPKYT